jgi:hypothetical protein
MVREGGDAVDGAVLASFGCGSLCRQAAAIAAPVRFHGGEAIK